MTARHPRFDHRAWPDLAIDRDGDDPLRRLCLLPVGAIEQHGPHLPCDTDSLIAQSLCDEVARRTGCLSLPVLAYGCSFGHGEAWPGTLSLSPETLTRTVRELGQWLMATGFTRLLIVNSHFGNWAALKCAIDHLRLRHAGAIGVGCANSWELTRQVKAWFLSDGDDIHANRAETSLVLHLAPKRVCRSRIADADDPDRTDGLVLTWLVPQTSANGVTGAPSRATAAEGARWFSRMAAALAAKARRAAVEQPPIAWARRPDAIPPILE
jgi:creatinine amidohydrolase